MPHTRLYSPNALKEGVESSFGPSEPVRKMLQTSEKLRQRKASDISFQPALILRNDEAILFPKTINAIQGQTGAHKSRFAEVLCAVILKEAYCESKLLGFDKGKQASLFHILYVDTERNLDDQLPFALQRLQELAGYQKSDNPSRFHYTSLLEVDRTARFKALEEFIEHLRRQIGDGPLFVVLDVTSDCIDDFNRTESSLQLLDMMNIAINRQNVTFLCILHENPGSEKMRGHLGTELSNKSSTVIQVAFEKDARHNDTNMLKVTFKKCRSTKRHEPFYMKYSEIGNELVLADEIDLTILDNAKKTKAPTDEIKELLTELLGNQQRLKRADLIKKLCECTKASENTIENRLRGLRETGTTIKDLKGVSCTLSKEPESRTVAYFLCPILDEVASPDGRSQSQDPI